MHVRGRPWWLFAVGNLTGAAIVAALFLVGPFAATPELEPGELVILSGTDDSPGNPRQALIELWNATHPRNQATIVNLNQVADGQLQEMLARAQDDETDIFNLDSTWTATFAKPPSGRPLIRPITVTDLGENPDRAFMAKPLSSCRYDGDLWALPFNTDAGLLYYRTDQGLKPPFDWDAVARTTRPGFDAAWTGQLGEYEGLTVNFLEAVYAAGGTLDVTSDNTVRLDLAAWDKAVERLTDPKVVLPDSTSYEEAGSTDAFREGRVPFMRNWPVASRSLRTTDQPTAPAAGRSAPPTTRPAIPFDLARLPGDSVLGGQNLAISARTGQPRAAQALIEFLTNKRSQEILFDGGFAATRATVYEDEEIKQRYPYATLLREAVDSARVRPVTPFYSNFSQELYTQVSLVLIGRTDRLPRDLADRLTAALQGR